MRLAAFFGTTPQFWLGLQALYDLEEARLTLGRELEKIPCLQRQGPDECASRSGMSLWPGLFFGGGGIGARFRSAGSAIGIEQ